MATVDRDILTIVEPTIEVDEVFVEDEESEEAEKESSPENNNQTMSQQSYEGGVYPMVQIGSNKIMQEDLDDMELNLTGLIPTAKFTISYTSDKFTKEYPLDGELKDKLLNVFFTLLIIIINFYGWVLG